MGKGKQEGRLGKEVLLGCAEIVKRKGLALRLTKVLAGISEFTSSIDRTTIAMVAS